MRLRPLALLLVSLLLPCFAAPLSAQEMSMDWDFDLLRRPDGRPLHSAYWVSLPTQPDLQDSANTASPNANKCVGDADGPTIPDGLFNVDDLICSWWSARSNPASAGSFTVYQVRHDDCVTIARSGTIALGRVRLVGSAFAVDPEAGLGVLVTVASHSSANPRNPVEIKGAEPAWAGRILAPAPTCDAPGATQCCSASAPRQHFLHVPWDTLLADANAILCGLEDVDWEDADGDGNPDACWDDADGDGARGPGEAITGLWDGHHFLSVARWSNDPASNGMISRNVTWQLGAQRMTGTNYDLVSGEAYMVNMSLSHEPVLWLPDVP